MDIDVSIPLEKGLDLCWRTLAECFTRDELLMKETLIDKYLPTLDDDAPIQAAA